jgi:hypothetical protein
MNKYLFSFAVILSIVSALYFLHPTQTSQGIAVICPKCYLLGASRVLGKNGQLYQVVAASGTGHLRGDVLNPLTGQQFLN